MGTEPRACRRRLSRELSSRTRRPAKTDELDDELAEAPSELAAAAPGVWAEGQQNFAPYSQLFSRLKQRRDPK